MFRRILQLDIPQPQQEQSNMGLLSFVFGRRTKENAASSRGSPSTKAEQKTRTSPQQTSDGDAVATLPRKPSPVHVTQDHTKTVSQVPELTSATSNDPKAEDGKSRRKSRRFSLGRVKAEEMMRRRSSIFGAKANEETPQTPAVPAMWQGHDQRVKPSMDEDVRPGTAITVDEPVDATIPADDRAAAKGINTRLTLLEKPARKPSKAGKASTTLGRKSSRRRSLFGGVADDDDEDAPVLPAVPVKLAKPKSVKGSDVAEKRKSRSAPSSQARRSQRWSLFQSSNPDDGEDAKQSVPAVPPVRSLDRSTSSSSPTAKPSHAQGISYYSVYADKATAPTTYRPRSSAKGFLNTTTGGTENARRSFRQSLYTDGEEDVSFLSPEQQREWDKMRLLMEAIEARDDVTTGDRAEDVSDARLPKSDAERFSNAQALAALEFGVAI
nr:hypothetical protein CFP56_09964 [Quercus suber]POF26258.1 hypothetical protein CFP56_22407 [Quercus suber]